MQYAGPYNAETAAFIGESIIPLQKEAAEAEDAFFAAKQTVGDYVSTQRIAALSEKQYSMVAAIPPLTENDYHMFSAAEIDKYKVTQGKAEEFLTEEEKRFLSDLERRALDNRIAAETHASNLSLARDYLQNQSIPVVASTGVSSKEQEAEIIKQAVTVATKKLEDGLRAEYQKVSPTLPSLEEEAHQKRKKAEDVAGGPVGLSEGLNALTGGPLDVNSVGYAKMVCRHRAPLARAMLDFLGVQSELLTGSAINDYGKIGHVTVYMPGLHAILEPSSDSFSLRPIAGKWPKNPARGDSPRHSIRTDDGGGYELTYSDAVLPEPRMMNLQPEVEQLRRKARNEFHLDAIISQSQPPAHSDAEIYKLVMGIKDKLSYFQEGDPQWIEVRELSKGMTPAQQQDFDRLLRQRASLKADSRKNRPTDALFHISTPQEMDRKDIDTQLESLGSSAYTLTAYPQLLSQAKELFQYRELSPAGFSEPDLLLLARDEAKQILGELEKKDPAKTYAMTPGAVVVWPSDTNTARPNRDWVMVQKQ